MKIAKLRDISKEELVQRKEEMCKQIFQLRQQASVGQAEGASKISGLRKDIARILTLLEERKHNAA
jgi:large subunit ribosomal protein L29